MLGLFTRCTLDQAESRIPVRHQRKKGGEKIYLAWLFINWLESLFPRGFEFSERLWISILYWYQEVIFPSFLFPGVATRGCRGLRRAGGAVPPPFGLQHQIGLAPRKLTIQIPLFLIAHVWPGPLSPTFLVCTDVSFQLHSSAPQSAGRLTGTTMLRYHIPQTSGNIIHGSWPTFVWFVLVPAAQGTGWCNWEAHISLIISNLLD